MRSLTFFKILLIITITLTIAVTVSEARGGRRGGSFGGVFGNWRKYKKHGSSGNGNNRRPIISGSPVAGYPSHQHGSAAAGPEKKTKLHHDNHHRDPPPPYPGTAGSSHHQQLHDPPPPYPGLSNAGFRPHPHQYYAGASGATHLPPGGTYHANPASIPQGAVYSAQTPVRSGNNDYLFGLMVGHALSSSHRHRVHHHYTNNNNNQKQNQTAAQNGTNVTIFENGNGTSENYWPTDTVVPLAPINTSPSPANDASTNTAYQQPLPDAPAGIICVPMLFNETDSEDSTKIVQVQKTICYPAPPPLPPNCVIRTFIEADPASPTNTIEVQKQICKSDIASTTAIQVAGEIGEQPAHGKH